MPPQDLSITLPLQMWAYINQLLLKQPAGEVIQIIMLLEQQLRVAVNATHRNGLDAPNQLTQ